MISDEYREYLRSSRWNFLRSQRLKIDGYKCQKCGKPFNLQVHHLKYPLVLGTEDPYTDLITLCTECHEDVETQKAEYRKKIEEAWEEEKAARKRKRDRDLYLLWDIIKKKADAKDLSNVGIGNRDYCNISIIKEDFKHVVEDYGISLGYVNRVQAYCRNKRYRIILDMLEHGYPQDIIRAQTLFSASMISKVAKDPERAEMILRREIEFND